MAGSAPGQAAGDCLGVLTGISYVSGLDYFRGVNERYTELVGKRHLMPPNPDVLLASVDCDVYAKMLTEKKWDGVAEHLLTGVDRLVKGGATCLVIASNTGHIAVPAIERKHPGLPVLHIADCTAHAIRLRSASRVGLVGTEPTMRERYLKDRLGLHGIDVLVPEEDALAVIFQHIMDELGFGVFKDSTRAFFVSEIRKLAARGAEGVILGCTEIELLVRQEDCPEVPLYPSAELHIAAAARVTAGAAAIKDFAPSAGGGEDAL